MTSDSKIALQEAEPLPERWIQALRRSELFAELDTAAFECLATGLEGKTIEPGQDLVRQGDEADSLFVVVDGRVDVLIEGGEDMALRRLGPGSVIGEIALVVGGKRSATVRAVERTFALELSRERFERVLEEHPQILEPLARQMREGMRRVKVAGHLRDLFGELDVEQLREIEREMTWVRLPSGRELFRQGDQPDGAYIIVVGRLRVVVRTPAGDERVIDETGPGQWVGEMALLTGKERSATVYAVRDTELVWLSQAAFDKRVANHPRAMRETARVLVTRMQRQMRGESDPNSGTSTFAVVPVGPGVEVDQFVAQFVSALGEFGSVLHLTADRVDAHLGKKGISRVPADDPAQLRVAPWLIEQEDRHCFVVYQADEQWTGWTERAVRHADRILLVANARASATRSEIEHRLASSFEGGRTPKQDLVLLQSGYKETFSGTASWLAGRDLVGHHHVRIGRRSDAARLARILSGRAVCLVLGGGGSRGYAHLGVLRAFDELGIPIDAIGGTSMGALIAGSIAYGMSWRTVLDEIPPRLTKGFANVTLPWVSLLSGRVVMDGLHDIVGSLEIEDIATPFFCISTNLTRGVEVLHRRGSLALAVRASTSIPGVFPPVPWNGELLVDGGLSNNIPVDTMLSLYGGATVAVDVMPDFELQSSGTLPTSLSGWTMAHRRLNPFVQALGMPDIMSILIRSATSASRAGQGAETAAKLATLFVRPQVTRWNLVDFKTAAPVAEEGYRSTVEQIQAWWARDRARLLGPA